ncbi:hypothetical protein PROFUN_03843 [Planoprotostelium fungivorum]|uniref:Cation transporter n=1 Tax=Planoprotostelium fungivorum TaxID=1890364 RepID=A0A2P6NIA0_9EUKA|nr:hypothetical protein PROFUN_03843 [Planoprotostelium fungivorum]
MRQQRYSMKDKFSVCYSVNQARTSTHEGVSVFLLSGNDGGAPLCAQLGNDNIPNALWSTVQNCPLDCGNTGLQCSLELCVYDGPPEQSKRYASDLTFSRRGGDRSLLFRTNTNEKEEQSTDTMAPQTIGSYLAFIPFILSLLAGTSLLILMMFNLFFAAFAAPFLVCSFILFFYVRGLRIACRTTTPITTGTIILAVLSCLVMAVGFAIAGCLWVFGNGMSSSGCGQLQGSQREQCNDWHRNHQWDFLAVIPAWIVFCILVVLPLVLVMRHVKRWLIRSCAERIRTRLNLLSESLRRKDTLKMRCKSSKSKENTTPSQSSTTTSMQTDVEESLIDLDFRDISPSEIGQMVKDMPNRLRQGTMQGKNWIISKILDVSFLNLHVTYFLILGFLGSIILFVFELNNTNISYVDAFFMSFSSVCSVGLSTVEIHPLHYASQIILFILFHLGGSVFTTLGVLIVRRHFFRKRFIYGDLSDLPQTVQIEGGVAQVDAVRSESTPRRSIDRRVSNEIQSRATTPRMLPPPPASVVDDVKIHEVEYVSLSRLMYIVVGYMITIYTTSIILLCIWSYTDRDAVAGLEMDGVNPFFFSVFETFAAFNNAGLTLTKENAVLFHRSRFFLLWMCLLITLGNTGFPIALRFIVYLFRWISRRIRGELTLRRRYSSTPAPYKILLTKILTITWLLITTTQMVVMSVLGGRGTAFDGMSTSDRILNSFFMSVSTRTGGFNSVAVEQLGGGVLVLFVVFMYIAAYPFVVALHGSAVLESDEFVDDDDEASKVQRDAYTGMRLKSAPKARRGMRSLVNAISFHTQSLFFQHIVWLIVVWFLVTAVESQKIDTEFSVAFRAIFEIASAYGTVGLSIGVGYTSYSGVLTPFSKFLIVTVMFIGRHRGLPSSLDPAINLYQKPKKKEDETAI